MLEEDPPCGRCSESAPGSLQAPVVPERGEGGHLPGDTVYDVLASAAGRHMWNSPRIETRHTHGTGCTLASAIAAGLAQGMAIEPAVERARAYVQRAIAGAPGFGRGHGPLDHAHPLRSH